MSASVKPNVEKLVEELSKIDPDKLKELTGEKRIGAKYSTTDGKSFQAVDCNCEKLDAGIYRTYMDYQGNITFTKIGSADGDILKFPNQDQENIIKEMREFWGKESFYKQAGLSFKRGILLYGPQGSGKTSVSKMVVNDVIQRGGIAIDFKNPDFDVPALQFFRKAEPTRPLVVLMEDIDILVADGNAKKESDVLNILDGMFKIENVIFLATTNHPEKLEARITNRPSRFDRVIQIGLPAEEDRKFYLENIIKKFEKENKNFNIKKWVKDTETLSVAHLKELVVSVFIYGYDYEKTLHLLDKMKRPPKVDGEAVVGFNEEKS